MQIFSELQRNSAYYVFIKLIVLVAVLLLNSSNYLFPLLIGFVFFCENIFIAAFYLTIFAVLHKYPVIYLAFIFFVYRFFIHEKIAAYIDRQYQSFVGIFVIYTLFSLVYFPVNKFLVIYILFNYMLDSVLAKVFKCAPK